MQHGRGHATGKVMQQGHAARPCSTGRGTRPWRAGSALWTWPCSPAVRGKLGRATCYLPPATCYEISAPGAGPASAQRCRNGALSAAAACALRRSSHWHCARNSHPRIARPIATSRETQRRLGPLVETAGKLGRSRLMYDEPCVASDRIGSDRIGTKNKMSALASNSVLGSGISRLAAVSLRSLGYSH